MEYGQTFLAERMCVREFKAEMRLRVFRLQAKLHEAFDRLTPSLIQSSKDLVYYFMTEHGYQVVSSEIYENEYLHVTVLRPPTHVLITSDAIKQLIGDLDCS